MKNEEAVLTPILSTKKSNFFGFLNRPFWEYHDAFLPC